MITRPPYKEALGIATGDVVSTSYGTGPYEIWGIWGPDYWRKDLHSVIIWPYPVISLSLFTPGNPPTYKDDHRFFYLNDIHREGDRWLSDQGDEIFVSKPNGVKYIQAGLFVAAVTPEPYPFQPGIDYHAGDRYVFHCPGCGKDFNAVKDGYYLEHGCGTRKGAMSIIMMGDGSNRQSSYVRSLNA